MGAGVGIITAALPRKGVGKAQIEYEDGTPGSDYAHHAPGFPTASSSSHSVGAGSNSPYLPHSATYGSTSHGSLDGFGMGLTRVHSSPERHRRDSTTFLNCVPEDGTIEFDHEEGVRYAGGSTPDDDEEEAERELDEELEGHGLYRGSYSRLLISYTLAPLTFIVTFALVALLPAIAYPLDRNHAPPSYPYAPYIPFPVPEFLLAVALWSFAHLLRDPLYTLVTTLTFIPPALLILFSTAVHTFLALVLQQLALPLLQVPYNTLSRYPTIEDHAFRRVWWIALGWATAEGVVGIKQGYEAIALYRDVLVTVRRSGDVESSESSRKPESRPLDTTHNDGSSTSQTTRSFSGKSLATARVGTGQSTIDLFNQQVEDDVYGHPPGFNEDGDGERELLLPRGAEPNSYELRMENALKMQVEHDIDQLIVLKNREELEEAYGMPVIRIPVFISCLQRVNSILLSLGVCLLLSHAYIRSTIAVSHSQFGAIHGDAAKTNTPLLVTFPLVAFVQFCLAVLHTPLLLPRLGVPTVVYTGSLMSLGSFFAGLGVWEALS